MVNAAARDLEMPLRVRKSIEKHKRCSIETSRGTTLRTPHSAGRSHQTSLGTFLRSMFLIGRLSAPEVQEGASGAVQEGSDDPLTRRFSRVGKHGKYRDITPDVDTYQYISRYVCRSCNTLSRLCQYYASMVFVGVNPWIRFPELNPWAYLRPWWSMRYVWTYRSTSVSIRVYIYIYTLYTERNTSYISY